MFLNGKRTGVSHGGIEQKIGLSLGAVSISVSRGERIAKDHQISLVDELQLKE